MLRYNCVCRQTEEDGSGFASAQSAAVARLPSNLQRHLTGALGGMLSPALGFLVAKLPCSDEGPPGTFGQHSIVVPLSGRQPLHPSLGLG